MMSLQDPRDAPPQTPATQMHGVIPGRRRIWGMASIAGSPLLAGVSAAPGDPPGYPFRGPGAVARVAPFAVVVVLAEVSLALPSGTVSLWPAVASLVLLVAIAAAFRLPWARLPVWMSVLVPLAGTGWVLALLLAEDGSHVGLAPIALIPALWAALFHRRWESTCVVAAVAAVQIVDSLVPAPASASAITRRVILWVLLGGLISVAVQGLRERIRRAHRDTDELQERLRELTLMEDRDRIAADLQDKVVQPILAAGLTLQGAAALASDTEVSRRVAASVEDLDGVLRALRLTIFGMDKRLSRQGLRNEVLELSETLSPPPEVTFTGPVDGVLQPGVSAQMVAVLRDGLDLIRRQFLPVRIGVTAGDTSYVTVIEAIPRSGAAEVNGITAGFSMLRERAARSGIRLGIEPGVDGTRFAWQVPLRPGRNQRLRPGTNVPRPGDSLPCPGFRACAEAYFKRLTPGGGERGGARWRCLQTVSGLGGQNRPATARSTGKPARPGRMRHSCSPRSRRPRCPAGRYTASGLSA
jgi:signal transduction histidine kinase